MPLHITWISASLIIYTLRTTSTEYCPDGLFTCTNGKCIEYDRVCDDKMDCTDRTDESGCGCTKADLGLVIDSSGSITESHFKDGLSFLTNFLSFFDIGPGLSQIRVAAVIYGEGVYANGSFSLDTYSSKKDVLNAIKRTPYYAGGSTYTGQAIQSMRENQMSRVRDFPVRKIMIILTDGNSDHRNITAQEANTTRQQGFTIFSVGVGSGVSEEELMNIAGSPDRILKSNSYDNLRNIRDDFIWKVCGVPSGLDVFLSNSITLLHNNLIRLTWTEHYFVEEVLYSNHVQYQQKLSLVITAITGLM